MYIKNLKKEITAKKLRTIAIQISQGNAMYTSLKSIAFLVDLYRIIVLKCVICQYVSVVMTSV